MRRHRLKRHLAAAVLVAGLTASLAAGPLPATAAPDDARPYDQELLRLAEILGAIHYLRELCGSDDGQKWREHMQEIIRTEGTSALRRAIISRRFNRGYRGYGRTYRTCTASAKATIERFLVEAVEISDSLARFGKP